MTQTLNHRLTPPHLTPRSLRISSDILDLHSKTRTLWKNPDFLTVRCCLVPTWSAQLTSPLSISVFPPFNQWFTVRHRHYLTTAQSLAKVRGHNYSSTSGTAVFKEKSSPFRKKRLSAFHGDSAVTQVDNDMLALSVIEDRPCLHKHASFCTNIQFWLEGFKMSPTNIQFGWSCPDSNEIKINRIKLEIVGWLL